MKTRAIGALIRSGVLSLLLAPAAQAAQLVLSDDDCRQVVEAWASDREATTPPALLEACKEQVAAAAEGQPLPEPAIAALPEAELNPCAGAGASDSVLCWGPWAALAPEAGAEPLPKAVASASVTQVSCRPELAGQCDPELEPLPPPPPIITLPLGSCPPGTPCGFATLVAGVTSNADSEDTRFVRIALAADGSAFVVDADDLMAIVSVQGMQVIFTPRATDDYENLRANGSAGGQQSRLVARVVRDDSGELLLAADVWGHGNSTTGAANSGYFAWGLASGQAGLDVLNAGSVSLDFTGPMSVDNQTAAALRIEFGSSPAWTGSWSNPAWNFSAGGTVSGADLISQPDRFSGNVVAADSFVQGALLGEQGQRALAHIIDVNLVDQGRIRDVGLLREALISPGLAPDPAP